MTTSIAQVADMIGKLADNMSTLADGQLALASRLSTLESSTPKSTTRKVKANSKAKVKGPKAPAKLAIDFPRIAGYELTTTKARRSMERWSRAQNTDRLECYAGVRPCPHEEPHNVAVVEANKAFAVKLLGHLEGKNMPIIKTRKARASEAVVPDANQVESEAVPPHTSPKAIKRARKARKA